MNDSFQGCAAISFFRSMQDKTVKICIIFHVLPDTIVLGMHEISIKQKDLQTQELAGERKRERVGAASKEVRLACEKRKQLGNRNGGRKCS